MTLPHPRRSWTTRSRSNDGTTITPTHTASHWGHLKRDLRPVAIMLALCCACLLTACGQPPAPAPAQPAAQTTPAASGASQNPTETQTLAAQHPRQKQKLRLKILREVVGVDQDKALEVDAILGAMDAEQYENAVQIRNARRRMRRLLDEDSQDQAAFKEAMDKLAAANRTMQSLHARQFTALEGALEPRQQALFVLGMERVRRRLLQELGQAPANRPGRAHRDGPPRHRPPPPPPGFSAPTEGHEAPQNHRPHPPDRRP